MSNPEGKGLKQWLVEQIDSGQYPGLKWEDESHTMFRIPWEHGRAKEYNREVDAAIFKAWAEHTGRFKAEDDTEKWKNDLNHDLKKVSDFKKVATYRLYRIEEEKHGKSSVMAVAATNCTEMETVTTGLDKLTIKDQATLQAEDNQGAMTAGGGGGGGEKKKKKKKKKEDEEEEDEEDEEESESV